MERYISYLRVSTLGQAESEAGLRAQEDACRSLAVRAGGELVGPFSDPGVSGATPLDKRPGLIEALSHLGEGDALVVAKRDRLGRAPIVVAFIEGAVRKKGGRVVSAAGEGTDDDSPASILMRRVIDGVAEYERLVNKARTVAALAAKKTRAERTGSIPWGFHLVDDGRRSKSGRPLALVPSAIDAATMVLVCQLRADGLSLRGIAAELDRRGIPSKKGGPWSFVSVRKFLDRAAPNEPIPQEVPSHAAESWTQGRSGPNRGHPLASAPGDDPGAGRVGRVAGQRGRGRPGSAPPVPRGRKQLRLDIVDRLAEVLGLRLIEGARGRPSSPAKRPRASRPAST